MRFMMLMIPDVYQRPIPPDFAPPEEAIAAMGRYNEDLFRSGVLLAGDGLYPPETGARVTYEGGKAKVTDGPFSEAKEVLGGYWIIDVKSREEAVEWARRIPAAPGDVVEVRQVQELEDFARSEAAEIHLRLRDQMLAKK